MFPTFSGLPRTVEKMEYQCIPLVWIKVGVIIAYQENVKTGAPGPGTGLYTVGRSRRQPPPGGAQCGKIYVFGPLAERRIIAFTYLLHTFYTAFT